MKLPLFLSSMLVLALAISARAEDAPKKDAPGKPDAPKEFKVKVGDAAPDFAMPKPDRKGGSTETVKLSELKGKKNVLLAFYPKAFTGGCTKQLCGYRDDFDKFKTADVEVVAVSTDKQEESTRFKGEYSMPFIVLGDPDRKIIEAYGVPVMARGDAQYAQRSIVLIDKEGKVSYIDQDYKIGEDEKPLFEAIDKLKVKIAGDAARKP